MQMPDSMQRQHENRHIGHQIRHADGPISCGNIATMADLVALVCVYPVVGKGLADGDDDDEGADPVQEDYCCDGDDGAPVGWCDEDPVVEAGDGEFGESDADGVEEFDCFVDFLEEDCGGLHVPT